MRVYLVCSDVIILYSVTFARAVDLDEGMDRAASRVFETVSRLCTCKVIFPFALVVYIRS
jgi:hypothetical protein